MTGTSRHLLYAPNGFIDRVWSTIDDHALNLDSYEFSLILDDAYTQSEWDKFRWVIRDREFRDRWYQLGCGLIHWHSQWLYRVDGVPRLIKAPAITFESEEELVLFKLTLAHQNSK